MTYRTGPGNPSGGSGGPGNAGPRRGHAPRAGNATRRRRIEPPAGPGDRPISARQQAYREGRVTGSDILDRAVPRRAAGAVPSANYRPSHVRDGETTHLRRSRHAGSGRARSNRRRTDYPKIVLRVVLLALFAEATFVLLFSPRFDVTRTSVTGNASVPTDHIVSLLNIGPHTNIVRLPVGKLHKQVLGDVRIDSATIHRSLPGTLNVAIVERKPWASVCLQGGDCYTIDRKFVPFRSAPTPEHGLPKLQMALPDSGADGAVPAIVLGQKLAMPGLDTVDQCLAWADREHFPVDSLQIAPDGKLCLNETGGMQVQLGTSMNLSGKLASLSTLLQRKPELRDPNAAASIVYINLFDADAPAILTRAAQAAAQKQAATAVAKAARTSTDMSADAADSGVRKPAMTVQETSGDAAAASGPAAKP